jgi:hypothetical protein
VAQCAYCKTETELYEGPTPICVHCADLLPESRAVRAKLFHDLAEARLGAESAAMEFNAVTRDIPSFIPRPDGAQRIYNASRSLDAARKEMMTAHTRLNDFIERGIVPEDLKGSG